MEPCKSAGIYSIAKDSLVLRWRYPPFLFADIGASTVRWLAAAEVLWMWI